MKSLFARALLLVVLALSAAPSLALAQSAPAGPREAPAGGPLAGPDGNPDPNGAPAVARHAPEEARSMAIGAETGECRDTVPGGTLFAVAYAIVLLVLGAWCGMMAQKQNELAASVLALEAQLEQKRAERAGEPA